MSCKKKFDSHILRLAKSIRLRPETPDSPPSASFFTGNKLPFESFGRIGFSWWYSADTFYTLDVVATLFVQTSSEFHGCDIETVKETVSNVLQDICVERSVFDVDAVLLRKKITLYDCIAISPLEFATSIHREICTRLRQNMGCQSTIYPVPRFAVPSFVVPGEGVQLISCDDQEAWSRFVDSGYVVDQWSPLKSNLNSNDANAFSLPKGTTCLLVSEDNGTQRGTKFNAVLKLRVLSALLFASGCESTQYGISKSMADPFRLLLQFPHKTNSNHWISSDYTEPLIPYSASDVSLDSRDVNSLLKWYERYGRCNGEQKGRLEKCAYFVSRASTADEIDSYINYFVALDALFGRRGAVERSIVNGVSALNIEKSLVEKTTYLFDLRSELVHGGSRYSAEWPGYEKYRNHFRSDPNDDVRDLAHAALLQASELFLENKD